MSGGGGLAEEMTILQTEESLMTAPRKKESEAP